MLTMMRCLRSLALISSSIVSQRRRRIAFRNFLAVAEAIRPYLVGEQRGAAWCVRNGLLQAGQVS